MDAFTTDMAFEQGSVDGICGRLETFESTVELANEYEVDFDLVDAYVEGFDFGWWKALTQKCSSCGLPLIEHVTESFDEHGCTVVLG